jgi:hypothetical protein
MLLKFLDAKREVETANMGLRHVDRVRMRMKCIGVEVWIGFKRLMLVSTV